MIQRIQTVFFALVVVLSAILFFVPVYTLIVPGDQPSHAAGHAVYMLTDLTMLMIPVILLALLAVIAIFGYKNRPRQMRMARSGMFVSMIIVGITTTFPQAYLHNVDRTVLGYGIGVWLLVANIALFGLAFYFIRKDEKLVRSADRLR